jgi:hypothetical protein
MSPTRSCKRRRSVGKGCQIICGEGLRHRVITFSKLSTVSFRPSKTFWRRIKEKLLERGFVEQFVARVPDCQETVGCIRLKQPYSSHHSQENRKSGR